MKRKYGIWDIVLGILGFFGVLVVGSIMFVYMLVFMAKNKYKTGKWWA